MTWEPVGAHDNAPAAPSGLGAASGPGAGPLQEALELAGRGAGRASPNPLVGAVVVAGGRVVGRGFHDFTRRDHAEIVALREAGSEARGATLFVTLEPCSSHGRTPPCTDAIVTAGIARVVACTADPDARHAGEGFRRLRASGLEVRVGDLRREAVALNERWLGARRMGRPHVTLKLATSADGRLAAPGGPRWLTGEVARSRVQELRQRADAVMVGVGTVVADDPRLSLREGERPAGDAPGPWRCVLDPSLRTPPAARVLRPPDAGESARGAILYTRAGLQADAPRSRRAAALRAAGAEIVVVEQGSHADVSLDPRQVLQDLLARGLCGVLVEGGGVTAGRFLAAGLVDRFVHHVAPRLLGGEGVACVAGALPLAGGLRLRETEITMLGDDVELSSVVEGGFDPSEEEARLAALEGEASCSPA